MNRIEAGNRIFVALDGMTAEQAIALADRIGHKVGGFKIGLDLISRQQAGIVAEYMVKKGYRFFWDGKLDDIPKTVGDAAKAIATWGAMMFNVHASAGVDAMRAAVANKGQSLVLAVTVLTSLEENEAHLIFGAPNRAKVLQFARDAVLAGCDGVVCSPLELEVLGKRPELKVLIEVTPGVRPVGSSKGDQARVTTPGEAIKAGADYLVIGRPITEPDSGTPEEAVDRIVEEIAEALG